MRRMVSWVFLLASLALYLWVMGLLWFISEIPRLENESAQRTDVAVVLTGGSLRLQHGFDLLREGMVEKLFISGVARGASLQEVVQEIKNTAAVDSITPKVTLGYEANDTQGNAEETARWLQREHIKSLRLVTANYHMPRAVAEFRASAPEVEIIPDPVLPEHFRREDWWRYPGTIRLIFSEYHKYIARRLQYVLHVENLRLKPKVAP